MDAAGLSFLVVFSAGILTFFSPCTFPLIPVYISYISGIGVTDVKNGLENKARLKMFLNTVFFVLGFTLVFVLLQLSFIYFTNFISTYINIRMINKVLGVLVIILGIHFTGLFRINALFAEKRFELKIKTGHYLTSILIGMAFAFGWTPCMGPILAGVISYASNSANLVQGIFLMVVYSLGLGIPFMIAGLFMDYMLKFISKVKKHLRKFEITSGILLILMGLMLFFNKMNLLSIIFEMIISGNAKDIPLMLGF